ncbi:hypothetical protein NLX69_20310 [Rossellomorea sp. BNER]|nr:hypothetical protein [Rossellomorea sp. BNER]
MSIGQYMAGFGQINRADGQIIFSFGQIIADSRQINSLDPLLFIAVAV